MRARRLRMLLSVRETGWRVNRGCLGVDAPMVAARSEQKRKRRAKDLRDPNLTAVGSASAVALCGLYPKTDTLCPIITVSYSSRRHKGTTLTPLGRFRECVSDGACVSDTLHATCACARWHSRAPVSRGKWGKRKMKIGQSVEADSCRIGRPGTPGAMFRAVTRLLSALSECRIHRRRYSVHLVGE